LAVDETPVEELPKPSVAELSNKLSPAGLKPTANHVVAVAFRPPLVAMAPEPPEPRLPNTTAALAEPTASAAPVKIVRIVFFMMYTWVEMLWVEMFV
jgi:hypothetical protein